MKKPVKRRKRLAGTPAADAAKGDISAAEAENTKQLDRLTSLGLGSVEAVDGVIAATNLPDAVARAEGGDVHAAKELLSLSTAYLSTDVFGPMPDVLRRYLARAFLQVTFGKPSDIALHLKKPKGGRRGHSNKTKLAVGHRLRKVMQQRLVTLETASFELSIEIAEGIKQYGEFYGFKRAPDSKTLEGIYSEAKPKLDALYAATNGERPSAPPSERRFEAKTSASQRE